MHLGLVPNGFVFGMGEDEKGWRHGMGKERTSPRGGWYHTQFGYGKIKGRAAYLVTPKDNYSKEQKLRE